MVLSVSQTILTKVRKIQSLNAQMHVQKEKNVCFSFLALDQRKETAFGKEQQAQIALKD